MKHNQVKPAHVLLVEDNEGDILLTKEAFHESNVFTEISVARNGQEALDFVFQEGKFKNAQRPDIILLDINLPIFNGLVVLEKIKTHEHLKKIPVIMLTTSGNKKDINHAYQKHCNSYVEKPLDIDAFLKAILKIEQFWLQLSLLTH